MRREISWNKETHQLFFLRDTRPASASAFFAWFDCIQDVIPFRGNPPPLLN